MVDMSVHTGERELNAIDSGVVARLKQRVPRRGHGLAREKIADGIEVKARKNDVEASKPGRALPRATWRIQIDLLRHHEVEPVEPFKAVTRRQQRVDGLHACDYIRNR